MKSMRLSPQRGRKNSIEELEVRMEVISARRNKRKGLAYREGAVKVRTIFRSIETWRRSSTLYRRAQGSEISLWRSTLIWQVGQIVVSHLTNDKTLLRAWVQCLLCTHHLSRISFLIITLIKCTHKLRGTYCLVSNLGCLLRRQTTTCSLLHRAISTHSRWPILFRLIHKTLKTIFITCISNLWQVISLIRPWSRINPISCRISNQATIRWTLHSHNHLIRCQWLSHQAWATRRLSVSIRLHSIIKTNSTITARCRFHQQGTISNHL